MAEDVDTKFRATAADVSNNTITVTTDKSILRGFSVTTALSAHDVPVYDGSGGTLVATIPGSAGVGTWIECGDVRCPNGIYLDPNDSATGIVNVIHKTMKNFPDY